MELKPIIPYLPHFQAILNTITTILLGVGYGAIRRKDRMLHRQCMVSALVVSTIFMTSYLFYHAAVGYLPFTGQGYIRPVYFTLLASHIILAAVIVPMVLLTVYFAIRGNFLAHPRIARWTLPLWFYVSVSGIVIYILGFHIYTAEVLP